jgi:hypothetical protein
MTFMMQTPTETREFHASHNGATAVAIHHHRVSGEPVTLWTPAAPNARNPRRPRSKWSLVLYTRHAS